LITSCPSQTPRGPRKHINCREMATAGCSLIFPHLLTHLIDFNFGCHLVGGSEIPRSSADEILLLKNAY
jgi:hypothetical protein